MKKNLTSVFKASSLAAMNAVMLGSTLFFVIPEKVEAAPSCTITNAYFYPPGDRPDGWYKDSSQPQVKLTIEGQNCAGQAVEVSIVEKDGLGMDDDISGMDNRKFTFPANSNSFTINLNAGEDECEGVTSTGGIGYDCTYYAEVMTGFAGLSTFSTDGKSKGNLNYECDMACLTDWKVGSITAGPPISTQGTQGTQPTTVYACVAGNGIYACSPGNKIDLSDVPNNACAGKTPVQIPSSQCGQQATVTGEQGTPPATGGQGTPKPGQAAIDCTKLDKNSQEYANNCIYNPLPVEGLTDMLLLIMKGFLGITAIWAVTFIVIGGFKMVMSQGNEEAYTAAKKTVTWAVLGLVIALLSFAIVAMVQNFLQVDVLKPSLSFLWAKLTA